jgi:hypothetical protein
MAIGRGVAYIVVVKHMWIRLYAWDLRPHVVWHEALEYRNTPVQSHVPVAFSGLGRIFFEDNALDTSLKETISLGAQEKGPLKIGAASSHTSPVYHIVCKQLTLSRP